MKIRKNTLVVIGAIVAIIFVVSLLKSINKPVYSDINSTRPILGNVDADVKVVEYSDFQCPACSATASYPERLISDFGDEISVEYKHFPLSFHEYAFKAAEAAECANDQGYFWIYGKTLFSNQDELSVSNLKSYAKELGLDTISFNACLDSDAKKELVEDHIREGYAANIPGTPSFLVNGKRVDSLQYEDIKAEIENVLS